MSENRGEMIILAAAVPIKRSVLLPLLWNEGSYATKEQHREEKCNSVQMTGNHSLVFRPKVALVFGWSLESLPSSLGPMWKLQVPQGLMLSGPSSKLKPQASLEALRVALSYLRETHWRNCKLPTLHPHQLLGFVQREASVCKRIRPASWVGASSRLEVFFFLSISWNKTLWTDWSHCV